MDKNYPPKNDLLDTQEQMAALLAQNLLLQEQLSGARLGGAVPGTHHSDRMDNNVPAAIPRGGCEDGAGSLGNQPFATVRWWTRKSQGTGVTQGVGI